MAATRNVLRNLLPRVEARERERFYFASLAFMCVATSALIARAVGDTLFLSRLGSDRLPFMYMVGALATGLGAYACARAAPRFSTARIGILVAGILIFANLAVYLALNVLPVISRATAYLLADVSGRIPVLLYWAFVSEVFDARESRRLFGLLGAVGTAACLPAGLLVGPLARQFGVASLILVVCALLAGFILASRALQRRETIERPTGDGRTLVAANVHSAGQLHHKKQFLTIASLAALTSLVQTLVDYQFKASFTPLASGVALAAIFGQLYAYASLAALFIQLFLVHRILKWGGVFLSLCALPVGLLVTSLGILKTASASWVYAAKMLDITLTLTVNGAARQMLYRGIRSESRLQARALAEGLYQPLAVATAGTILAFTVDSLTVRIMAAITVVASLLWILLARTAYVSYVSGLLSSLRAARFDADDAPFALHERAVKKYVMDALTSASDEQVKYLAAVIPHVLPMAEHVNPEVRWTVVQAAAAGEFSATEKWLRARLTDPHPRVRAFAAAALINTGIDDATASGQATLKELVVSRSAADRQAAAEGLGEIRRRGFTPLLQRLLEGSREEVIEPALKAARTHPDPVLIPVIVPFLAKRQLAASASDALESIGTPAIRPVAMFLRKMPRGQRANAVKKLAGAVARHGDAAGLRLLERMLDLVGPEDQAAVFQAYADMARRQSHKHVVGEIDELISGEIRNAFARLETLRELGSSSATQLLRDALTHLVRCHLRHAFILLDTRVKKVDMMSLHSAFIRGSRERRSQVVELLHNVLPEVFETPIIDMLSEVVAKPSDEGADPRAAIARVLEKPPSDWTIAGALYAVSILKLTERNQEVRQFLEHPDPIVRQTALAALSQIEDHPTFIRDSHPLTRDFDDTVRRLAISLSGPR
jgi:ATP/ADP translocase/HEAT repeat protein